jgi:hypothetical protein
MDGFSEEDWDLGENVSEPRRDIADQENIREIRAIND